MSRRDNRRIHQRRRAFLAYVPRKLPTGPYYGRVFDPADGPISVTIWVDETGFQIEAAFRETDGAEVQTSPDLDRVVGRALLHPLQPSLNLG